MPSAAERTSPFAAAAAARRDYGVLPRRVGTTARRQTQDNLPHFVFWCLVMADVPPPKRARTAAQEPPSVTPADVAPEAQSDLAAFLARPAAARTPPGKARSPGPLPPGLAAAAAASLERCWAELPPADASVAPRPDHLPRPRIMRHAGSPSPTSRSLPRRSTRSPARYLRRR